MKYILLKSVPPKHHSPMCIPSEFVAGTNKRTYAAVWWHEYPQKKETNSQDFKT